MVIDRVVMPAGCYVLGDPCYSLPSSVWQEVIPQIPIASFHGGTVLVFGTMHGDGHYRDQHGRGYGVDSGTIGLVPEGMADGAGEDVHLFYFPHDFECSSEGGVLKFGGVIINTDPDEEDEDD